MNKHVQLKEECDKLDRAVDEFAAIMKLKLHQKAAKGYRGWNDRDCKPIIQQELIRHAAELYLGDANQAVDVANLAMMLGRM